VTGLGFSMSTCRISQVSPACCSNFGAPCRNSSKWLLFRNKKSELTDCDHQTICCAPYYLNGGKCQKDDDSSWWLQCLSKW
jgi:hypothetical protein